MDMKVLREREHMDEIVMEECAAMFRTVKQFQDESDQKLQKEHNDMDNIFLRTISLLAPSHSI
jgi:hypothetical protein